MSIALLHRHLNGETLTEQEGESLSSWVCASPVNAKLAAELSNVDQSIAAELRHRASAQLMDTQDEGADLIDDTLSRDAYSAEIMQELVAQAQAKRAEDQQLTFESPAQVQPARQFTTSDAKWIAGKLFSHTIRSKAAAITAIAAVLLLAVILIVQFTSETQPVDETPIAQANPAPELAPEQPPVATLTATQNATWSPAEGASAPGSLTRGTNLQPNQRLTLTAGFAEITTRSGAVALLEAPATIELLNHNALHLHAGKLVGICETESSKGFLVRTPHMDVTDLGTRFGVDATLARSTKVHVFDGKVAVGRLDAPADTESTMLLAGESARATEITNAITSIDYDIDPFAAMLPPTISLPGTGQSLAAGEIDPRWRIIAVDGQEPDALLTVRVFDEPETRGHGPKDAQWIGLKTNGEGSVIGQGQTVVFQTQFWVPSAVDADTSTLQLSFIADYRLLSLVVNGQKVGVPPNQLHAKAREMVVSEHLVHGANSIRFEIQDDAGTRGVNYVGLRASWQLHTKNATP